MRVLCESVGFLPENGAISGTPGTLCLSVALNEVSMCKNYRIALIPAISDSSVSRRSRLSVIGR